ncbi:collagen alpha-1(I) chain-like [Antechinus flavipes]|uniref:collagen alpha-1(I) chain-like n=1 Tax=Antechinus flavipes TaxID=38775 RepID=UPI002235894C|nr:collagen alpha-1(I) chain-like [Antechinus flavipes]
MITGQRPVAPRAGSVPSCRRTRALGEAAEAGAPGRRRGESAPHPCVLSDSHPLLLSKGQRAAPGAEGTASPQGASRGSMGGGRPGELSGEPAGPEEGGRGRGSGDQTLQPRRVAVGAAPLDHLAGAHNGSRNQSTPGPLGPPLSTTCDRFSPVPRLLVALTVPQLPAAPGFRAGSRLPEASQRLPPEHGWGPWRVPGELLAGVKEGKRGPDAGGLPGPPTTGQHPALGPPEQGARGAAPPGPAEICGSFCSPVARLRGAKALPSPGPCLSSGPAEAAGEPDVPGESRAVGEAASPGAHTEARPGGGGQQRASEKPGARLCTAPESPQPQGLRKKRIPGLLLSKRSEGHTSGNRLSPSYRQESGGCPGSSSSLPRPPSFPDVLQRPSPPPRPLLCLTPSRGPGKGCQGAELPAHLEAKAAPGSLSFRSGAAERPPRGNGQG